MGFREDNRVVSGTGPQQVVAVPGPAVGYTRTVFGAFLHAPALNAAVFYKNVSSTLWRMSGVSMPAGQTANYFGGRKRAVLLPGEDLEIQIVFAGAWTGGFMFADQQPKATYAEGSTNAMQADGTGFAVAVPGPQTGFKRLITNMSIATTVASLPLEIKVTNGSSDLYWIEQGNVTTNDFIYDYPPTVVLLPGQQIEAQLVGLAGDDAYFVSAWIDVQS